MPENNNAALITGASGGIGKAVVKNISEIFQTCFNLDLNVQEEGLVENVKTDISSLDEVKKAVEIFARYDVKLTSIILCAGIGVHEKLSEGDPVKWKKVIDTNLLGPLNVIRAFLPFMSHGGDIIFISSVAAGQPHEYGGVYAATKTALNVIAETLRHELDRNVRVSIIEPGLVETGFMKNTISGDRSNEEFPHGAISPEKLGEAVRYILDQPRDVAINRLTIRPSGQRF